MVEFSAVSCLHLMVAWCYRVVGFDVQVTVSFRGFRRVVRVWFCAGVLEWNGGMVGTRHASIYKIEFRMRHTSLLSYYGHLVKRIISTEW